MPIHLRFSCFTFSFNHIQLLTHQTDPYRHKELLSKKWLKSHNQYLICHFSKFFLSLLLLLLLLFIPYILPHSLQVYNSQYQWNHTHLYLEVMWYRHYLVTVETTGIIAANCRGSTQRIRGGALDERRERAYSLDEEYDDDDDLDRKVRSYKLCVDYYYRGLSGKSSW